MSVLTNHLISLGPLLISSLSAFYVFYKFRSESLTQAKAEAVLMTLLTKSTMKIVPFRMIKFHIGGFEDQELRKLLVRVGAIRLRSASGIEHWALLKRLSKSDLASPYKINVPNNSVPAASAMNFVDERIEDSVSG